MKRCSRCKEMLDLEEYYKHPKMKDGRLNICKSCKKSESTKRYSEKSLDPEWIEKERIRGRKKYNKYKYKSKKSSDSTKKYRENHEKKYKATNLVNNLTFLGSS